MENTAVRKNALLNRTGVLLILIILLGALLRFHGLASRSIWYDEGCTIVQAKEIDLSFRFFNVDVISDPPVLAAMVHLWERYHAVPVRAEIATKNARRIWLVESWWEPFELPPQVLQLRGWLDSHFTRELSRAFDGVTVDLYVRGPSPAS